jgi:hypothetical protein
VSDGLLNTLLTDWLVRLASATTNLHSKKVTGSNL